MGPGELVDPPRVADVDHSPNLEKYSSLWEVIRRKTMQALPAGIVKTYHVYFLSKFRIKKK